MCKVLFEILIKETNTLLREKHEFDHRKKAILFAISEVSACIDSDARFEVDDSPIETFTTNAMFSILTLMDRIEYLVPKNRLNIRSFHELAVCELIRLSRF